MNDEQFFKSEACLIAATALVARAVDLVSDQAGDSLDTSVVKEGILAEMIVSELKKKLKESR